MAAVAQSSEIGSFMGSSGQRVDFVDVTRGLLILWMVSSHALGRAQIPSEHWAQWIRPHGWATFGFVMLSGFSIGFLFKWTHGGNQRLQHKLRRRALEIGLIAYLSNLIIITGKLFLENNLDPATFFKVASFQYPWGYSSILIPTFFLLLVAPKLLSLVAEYRPGAALIVTSVMVVAIETAVEYYGAEWSQYSLFHGLFDRNAYVIFPVGDLFIYAVWAVAFSSWIKILKTDREPWFAVGIFGAFIYFSAKMFLPYDSYDPIFLMTISRFGIILMIGYLLSTMRFTSLLKYGLGLIGRSALLVYILHRPFIEAAEILFADMASEKELAVLLIVSVIIFSFIICIIKEKNEAVASRLKLIGF